MYSPVTEFQKCFSERAVEMKKNKFGYKVDIGQRCEKDIEASKKYGHWERSYSNTFQKISKSKTDDVPDAVSDFDIQLCETCYVVWVEYSSGNSFGMAENENVEVVGVFKDKECARQLEKAIEEQNQAYRRGELAFGESWEDKNKFYCKTSDGQEFQYGFCPWYGYFEVLENVYVEEAVME